MKSVLVFIAPHWSPHLEELIQVTRETFSIKIISEKYTHSFIDPYVEMLQCLESYSPLEIGRLLPWFLQQKPVHFHFILPANPSARQLSGLGAIATLAKTVPDTTLTHSEWPKASWAFRLWLKAFGSLFSETQSLPCKRSLSLPSQPGHRETRLNESGVDFYRHRWVFPSLVGVDPAWQKLMTCLLMNRENILEFWNWERLAIRQQNKIREQFSSFWTQFQTHSPRLNFEDWSDVRYLVLLGEQELPFSETDLIDLATELEVCIIMDTYTRSHLKAPWKDGDTFWFWSESQRQNTNRPWNNPFVKLPFSTKLELKQYRDQISNQILRSFIKLDFQN
ncbi:MAG: hypothetical protein RJB66_846 [Pseudomonadota bacterium]|jgi:hypothetical protein